MKRYVLHIVEDVEPELLGPFSSERDLDAAARTLKAEHGDRDGIFWLTESDGHLTVGAYAGGFFHV